ncbi:MAG: right-handed parallel beta-helix repeat-containing protein [Bacteroidota bacterium]|nr:right-handed parallel beta-helix repeat-containing protein [Bacteroidota bacterium]
MKYFLLAAALLLDGPTAWATTYYLAANGDDMRSPTQAQSPTSPWQSLARLNTAMPLLQPGDHVLFHRGDVFGGQLTITRSGASGAPLTFGAYGAATDPAPVFSGSVPLSGWVSAGPNLWEAPCTGASTVTGLYTVGGRALPLGRYPNPSATNKGYLTIAAHTGNTGLTAPQLSGSWTGATAVVRSIRWVLDRAPVTGQNGTTLTLGPFENPYYTSGGLPDGWGFFLQNHPATLDQNGEWYYYPARNVLRVYAPSPPANGALEATTGAPAGVVIRNQQYLTIEDLTIAHTPRIALEGVNVSHLLVRGVQVLGTDENGVLLSGSGTDVLFENNLIRNVNNNAVNVGGYTDFTFRNNTLRNSGVVAGRGLGGDGQYYTFNLSDADRATLENNTLDSCGYVGLAYFRVSNISIARNVVSNFCLVKDDGGGIYTYNGGTPLQYVNARITNNIVLNGVGAPEGTNDPATVPAFGIYLDDCTRNTTVLDNTVAECSSGGIFLHGNSNVTASGNTSFNNGSQLVIAGAGACGSAGLTVQNNVLVSTKPGALVADYHVPPADLSQLGILSGNYYAEPFSDVLHIRYEYQNYLLSEWQALASQDAGSADGPVQYRLHRAQSFIGTERLTNGNFTTGINDWGAWASSGSRPIAWDNANALGSGGSLRLASPTPSPTGAGAVLTQSFMGPVVQGHSYLVRFSARCAAGAKLLEVYLEQSTPPFADLSPTRRLVVLDPTAQAYEVALTSTGNDTNALVTWQGIEDNRAVWLDNVTVREATLTPASVADSVRFEYNAAPTPRTVALPAGTRYLDVRNAAYSGSLMLAPYASVVLFRVNATAPLATHPVAAPAVGLWPNPAMGTTMLDLQALPAGAYQVTLFDATGQAVRRLTLAGGQVHLLNLTGLSTGVYLLRCEGQRAGLRFSLRLAKE